MLTGASFVVAVASLVPAVPFMLAHEISDFVFFAAVGPILVSTMLKVIKSRGTPLPHSGVQESLLSAAMVTMVSS
jgi:hypothetical protein